MLRSCNDFSNFYLAFFPFTHACLYSLQTGHSSTSILYIYHKKQYVIWIFVCGNKSSLLSLRVMNRPLLSGFLKTTTLRPGLGKNKSVLKPPGHFTAWRPPWRHYPPPSTKLSSSSSPQLRSVWLGVQGNSSVSVLCHCGDVISVHIWEIYNGFILSTWDKLCRNET